MFFRAFCLFLVFLNKILFFSEHKEPMSIPLNTFLNLDLFFFNNHDGRIPADVAWLHDFIFRSGL